MRVGFEILKHDLCFHEAKVFSPHGVLFLFVYPFDNIYFEYAPMFLISDLSLE